MAHAQRNPQQVNKGLDDRNTAKSSSGPDERPRAEEATPQGGLARSGGQGLGSSGVTGPFGVMRRFMEDLERIAGGTSGGLSSGWMPQLEMFRDGDDVVVRADVPGLGEKDISIEIEDDVLTISGERRSEHREESEGFFRSERSYGFFERSIRLPDGTDPDDIRASLEEGVLELRVRAPEEARRARRIPIRATSGAVEPEPAKRESDPNTH